MLALTLALATVLVSAAVFVSCVLNAGDGLLFNYRFASLSLAYLIAGITGLFFTSILSGIGPLIIF